MHKSSVKMATVLAALQLIGGALSCGTGKTASCGGVVLTFDIIVTALGSDYDSCRQAGTCACRGNYLNTQFVYDPNQDQICAATYDVNATTKDCTCNN